MVTIFDMMDTTAKGDGFEALCFELINKRLNDLLGVEAGNCKVFSKKGYYSKDREKEIIFDLSIELWPPNATRYSILYLVECKNYDTTIPVGKVEDFESKMRQVGAHKGIFITSTSFQEGAYTFAKNKGMMLLEVNENITLNVILHKAKRFSEKSIENDVEKDTNYLKRLLDKTLIGIFVDYLKNKSTANTNVPILSSAQIEEITVQILNYFDSRILERCSSLPLPRFLLFLKEVYGLQVLECDMSEIDSQGRPIMSNCSFADKTIRIDKSLIGTNKYAFVVCHEIGHFFLHNKILINQEAYELNNDSEYNVYEGKYILENERTWIEWQANQFASYMTMPTRSTIYKFAKCQTKIGLKEGTSLLVDDQDVNRKNFEYIVNQLSYLFEVSKTVIIYRLESLGLIRYGSKLKSLQQILHDMITNG